MKTLYRLYVLACIGIGVFFEHSFLGGFYGFLGSFIGPGIVAKGIGQFSGQWHFGAPGVLLSSIAFWMMMLTIAKRSPRKSAAPVTLAPGYEPGTLFHAFRTSTRTFFEEEE